MQLHEQVIEQIERARPHPTIQAAIEDRMEDAGIVTEQCPDAVVGSRLLNITSATFEVMRTQPHKPAIEHSVALPNNADLLTRLAVKALNDTRKPFRSQKSPSLQTAQNKRIGSCAMSEERFIEAIHDEPAFDDPDDEKSTLYIWKNGDPVMLSKERGENSALSFKQTIINGVRIGALALFSIKSNPQAAYLESDLFKVALFNTDTIAAVAPLRYSQFAFPPEDRVAIFKPVLSCYGTTTDNEDIITMEQTELRSTLPPTQELRRAAQLLKHSK